MHTVSKDVIARLHLWKQSLYHPPNGSGPMDALALVRDLGCVQLDTLNVVTRSQHLVFWSRMQTFRSEWLVDLYTDQRIHEYYLRALCILPAEEYRFFAPFVARIRQRLFETADAQARELMDALRDTLRVRQQLTSREVTRLFGSTPVQPGETWQMSTVRRALDQLWRAGVVRITRDAHFNKVYHLVSESNAPNPPGPVEETFRRYALLALKAMGAATESQVMEYFRFKRETVRRVLGELEKEGLLHRLRLKDDPEPYFIRAEDLPLLELPDLTDAPTHATFLSPFDNLIWDRNRLERIWDVCYRLESYVPEGKRQFGYFALPILIRGRIVGTIDLKAQTRSKALQINRLVYFDPAGPQEHAKTVSTILERLMHFLSLKTVSVADEAHSEIGVLGRLL